MRKQGDLLARRNSDLFSKTVNRLFKDNLEFTEVGVLNFMPLLTMEKYRLKMY